MKHAVERESCLYSQIVEKTSLLGNLVGFLKRSILKFLRFVPIIILGTYREMAR